MTKKPFYGHNDSEQEITVKRVTLYLNDQESAMLIENVDYLENLSYLTSNMKREVLREVCDEIDKFPKYIQIKEFRGELVLCKDSSKEYV